MVAKGQKASVVLEKCTGDLYLLVVSPICLGYNFLSEIMLVLIFYLFLLESLPNRWRHDRGPTNIWAMVKIYEAPSSQSG